MVASKKPRREPGLCSPLNSNKKSASQPWPRRTIASNLQSPLSLPKFEHGDLIHSNGFLFEWQYLKMDEKITRVMSYDHHTAGK
jgi:hypothetical protein